MRSTICRLIDSSLGRSGPLITNCTSAAAEPLPPIAATGCTAVRRPADSGGRTSLRTAFMTAN